MRIVPFAFTAAFLAFAMPAQAQDAWTGVYGGGAIGNIDGTSNGVDLDSETMASIIGGYNMDLGNSFVIGLEADVTSDRVTTKEFTYSLRPRAGYKMLNDIGLAYVTGGYAGTQIAGDDPDGWILGLGYEHQLTEYYHLRAEFLYSEQELGSMEVKTELLRAGLTTKF